MVKFLQLFQKLFTGFFIVIIAISLLTWLGVISPFERFEHNVRGSVGEKLLASAEKGDADAQNKLGTLLYVQAQKQKSDFSQAIGWLRKASQQNHPIAQMNLAYAYKAGNGVPIDNEKAIQLFHQCGLNYLRMGFPMDAKDAVYSIGQINKKHPMKLTLIQAIKEYENKH